MTRWSIVFIARLLFASAASVQTTYESRNDAKPDFSKTDANLNVAYKEATSSVPEEKLEGLKLAQCAWIAYRDACTKSEGAVCAGGTMEGVAAKGLVQEAVTKQHATAFD